MQGNLGFQFKIWESQELYQWFLDQWNNIANNVVNVSNTLDHPLGNATPLLNFTFDLNSFRLLLSSFFFKNSEVSLDNRLDYCGCFQATINSIKSLVTVA